MIDSSLSTASIGKAHGRFTLRVHVLSDRGVSYIRVREAELSCKAMTKPAFSGAKTHVGSRSMRLTPL